MYKIIFGHCDIDSSKFYDTVGPSRTRTNHNFKIRPNYFTYLFF